MKDSILIWFLFKYVVDLDLVTSQRSAPWVCADHPTFYHPDLLAVFSINGLNPFKSPKWSRYSDNINDPGWVRNSPLRIELVDLLNDALKAMGGWPKS